MSGINKFLDKFYPIIEPIAVKRRSATVFPADLFFAQVKNGEFARLDIISRYLFLENHHGLNDYGIKMYEKLYMARINTCADMVRNFNDLIASYEKNGYDPNSRIQVSRGLSIKNGNHRFALAIYYNEPVVVFVEDYDDELRYDADWYREQNFTEQEVRILTDKADELYSKLNAPINIFLFGGGVQNIDAAKRAIEPFGIITDIMTGSGDGIDLTCYKDQNEELKHLCSLCRKNSNTAVIRMVLNIPDVGFENKSKKVYIKQISALRKSLSDAGIRDEMLCLPVSFSSNEQFNAVADLICNAH